MHVTHIPQTGRMHGHGHALTLRAIIPCAKDAYVQYSTRHYIALRAMYVYRTAPTLAGLCGASMHACTVDVVSLAGGCRVFEGLEDVCAGACRCVRRGPFSRR